MTPRIVIDCGAADTRAALLVGDEARRFMLFPARGDEASPRPPQPGETYIGRVRKVARALRGMFIDIGAENDAFLPLKATDAVAPEGAAIIVRVRRPPVGGKGAVLARADGSQGLADVSREAGAPRRLGEPVDAAVEAAQALARGSSSTAVDVVTNSADALPALRDAGFAGSHDGAAFAAAGDALEDGLDNALETAMARVLALPGGGRLVIDETEAMTVVDVDAGAAADGGGARLNDRVNEAAARALFLALGLRGAGGRIVVDFTPPSGPQARRRLVETLKIAQRGVFEARLGKLSVDGLFEMTAPRTRLTLLEEITEPAGGPGWARDGRRFTVDWASKSAIRALENRLLAMPAARPRLLAGAGIADYLTLARPQWAERLAARYGARFEINSARNLEERSFDLAE